MLFIEIKTLTDHGQKYLQLMSQTKAKTLYKISNLALAFDELCC